MVCKKEYNNPINQIPLRVAHFGFAAVGFAAGWFPAAAAPCSSKKTRSRCRIIILQFLRGIPRINHRNIEANFEIYKMRRQPARPRCMNNWPQDSNTLCGTHPRGRFPASTPVRLLGEGRKPTCNNKPEGKGDGENVKEREGEERKALFRSEK